MGYIVKKTMFYNGVNKGDTFMTQNFSGSKIDNLMKKYPFKTYNEAHAFILEHQHYDYQATIRQDKNYKFEYEILEVK